MASMRDIKRRKVSIQSTQQITKAMKLVSTVKLQKSKTRAENAKPYFDMMYSTVCSMLAKSGNINHPYLTGGDSQKKAVIVITSFILVIIIVVAIFIILIIFIIFQFY